MGRKIAVVFVVVVLSTVSLAWGQTDAVDIGSVVFLGAPEHVKSWPVTNPIVRVELKSQRGTHDTGVGIGLASDTRWPDMTPPGWDGPLNWTLWIGVWCRGQVHMTPSLEYWSSAGGSRRGKYWSGAPLLTDYNEWVYQEPVMAGCPPKRGDKVYFMAVPVSHRRKVVESVPERSQIAEVVLVEDAVYMFTGAPPVPPAPPVTQPPVYTGGGDAVTSDQYRHLVALLENLSAQITASDQWQHGEALREQQSDVDFRRYIGTLREDIVEAINGVPRGGLATGDRVTQIGTAVLALVDIVLSRRAPSTAPAVP